MMSYNNCNSVIEDQDGLGGLWLGDYTAAIDLVIM